MYLTAAILLRTSEGEATLDMLQSELGRLELPVF